MMKLLFDQNISYRIIDLISKDFPESNHVAKLGLHNKTDFEIWNFAKDNSYTIVTFDSDFNDFSTLFGSPPKVIWLRLGNSSTKNVSKVLLKKSGVIKSFVKADLESSSSVLEIF